MGRRVLVCGGRDYGQTPEELLVLEDTLTLIWRADGIDVLINGDADGADKLSTAWAEDPKAPVPVLKFPADWEKHGRSAGAIRNSQMIEEGKPDLVIAFPGGRGTAMMVKKAKAKGIEVREITVEGYREYLDGKLS